MDETLGIAGSGAIACGLAATAARHGEVLLWARSQASAERARTSVAKICGRLSGEVNAAHVTVVTELSGLTAATVLVEAIAEDHEVKASLLRHLAAVAAPDALLATTTSSLSVGRLAAEAGTPELFGLHVFNPVPAMALVELVFPDGVPEAARARAHALCEALGKSAVEVPDTPGFVVNRLLFPYLFDAVTFAEESGMPAAEVDRCMVLGTGQPMGPLALLDFVGLDVAQAIGEELGVEVPARLRTLVADGALGRKTRRGLLTYD